MTSTPDLPTARRAARTLLAALAIVSALPGCSLTRASPPVSTYDLGPPVSTQTATGTLPRLRIAQTDGPTWMESNALFYRLQYSQAQRLQSYATQRWVIPPTQLFDGRLREAMAARGALTWFGDTTVPALKVDMLEFEQVFDSSTDTRVVRVRATVYHHGMIGQQTFTAREPAPSADGAGGVKALADATDKVIADMLAWAATLPLQAGKAASHGAGPRRRPPCRHRCRCPRRSSQAFAARAGRGGVLHAAGGLRQPVSVHRLDR